LASATDSLEEEERRVSVTPLTGLRGVSTPPSMLRTDSLLERLVTDPASPTATLSKFVFRVRLAGGEASGGRLMLLLPVLLVDDSSSRAVTPREPSLVMRPCVVTGVMAGLAVAIVFPFATLERFWALVLVVVALDADRVVMDDALEDCGGCDCVSVVAIPEEVAPDV